MIRRTIEALERHLKTDIRYLIKGGGVLIVGQIAVTFVALATSIAFANLLSKDAYGTYQYLLAVAEFLLAFSLIGMSRAVITSVARGFDGTLSYAFRKSMRWGAPALTVGLTVGGYYAYKENYIFAIGIAAATAATLLITSAKVYIPFLNGKQLFTATSISSLLGLLIPGMATIAALFLFRSILPVLLAYLISSAAVNVGLYLWSLRYCENDRLDPDTMHHALHISAENMVGRIAAQVDRVMLFQFAGPAILAEFWIAQSIERQFSHLFKSAKGIALPKLSTRSYSELASSLPRKVFLLYVLIVPFTLAYMVAVPYLVHLFFPQYASAIRYAQVMGLLFLSLPIKIFMDALVGHGRHRAMYRVTLISSSMKLVATLGLVPFFGIWGVIASTLLDQVVHSILIVWYFFREHRHS
jgi:O-antigen/teichoic acid export membrane protein